MPKVSYMHPLCKTYEEIRRCKERLAAMKINHIENESILALKLDTMIEKCDEIIGLIPAQYQKTRHELAKEAK